MKRERERERERERINIYEIIHATKDSCNTTLVTLTIKKVKNKLGYSSKSLLLIQAKKIQTPGSDSKEKLTHGITTNIKLKTKNEIIGVQDTCIHNVCRERAVRGTNQ
jgi:hypothetical protein